METIQGMESVALTISNSVLGIFIISYLIIWVATVYKVQKLPIKASNQHKV